MENVEDLRTKLLKELQNLSTDKNYRLKVDSGPYKEVKGKEHWNLYLTVELIEAFQRHVDAELTRTKSELETKIKEIQKPMAEMKRSIEHTESVLRDSLTRSMDGLTSEFHGHKGAIAHALDKASDNISAKVINYHDDLSHKISSLESIDSIHSEETASALKQALAALETLKTSAETMNEKLVDLESSVNSEMDRQMNDTRVKIAALESVTKAGLNNQTAVIRNEMQDLGSTISNSVDEKSNELKSLVLDLKGTLAILERTLQERYEAGFSESKEGLQILSDQVDSSHKALKEELDKTQIQMIETKGVISGDISRQMETMNKATDVKLEELRKTLIDVIRSESKSVSDQVTSARSDMELVKRAVANVSR